MSKPVKVMTVLLWVLAVAGMFGVVAMQLVNRNPGAAQAFPIYAPSFALTDQLGRPVATADLRGRPWVADFIFTECTSACPLMSQHLGELQKIISPQVKFISFSVDPDHDTPAALLAYARQYGADNDRWRFLTGDKAQVWAAVQGMKVSIVPATQESQIEHDIHYLLMDAGGQLRGVYDSRTPAELDRLARDANALAAELKP